MQSSAYHLFPKINDRLQPVAICSRTQGSTCKHAIPCDPLSARDIFIFYFNDHVPSEHRLVGESSLNFPPHPTVASCGTKDQIYSKGEITIVKMTLNIAEICISADRSTASPTNQAHLLSRSAGMLGMASWSPSTCFLNSANACRRIK